MITKPSIIVTSLGRTGTLFFYTFFKKTITNCTSLHEPDYLNFGQFSRWVERFRQVTRQIAESGISNLIIKKALGSWSLVNLSDARVLGKIGYEDAVRQVLRQRGAFVTSRSGAVYIESSSAYYGLIDVLKRVYAQHRVVYIIRDGRDWVRSKMNWGRMYMKGRLRGIVSHTWPKASDIENDPHGPQWNTMSRFEKICWAWATLNDYALNTIRVNPHARVIRFEDTFLSKDRYQHFEELVAFLASLPGMPPPAKGTLDGWLEKQIHKSAGAFPPWGEWSAEHKQRFKTICGPLMSKLHYTMD